jgi:hypothetical protein
VSEFVEVVSKGVPFLVARDGTIRTVDRQTPYSRKDKPHIVQMMRFKGRVLRPCKNNMGYLEVATRHMGRKVTKELVHRLVAKAFVPGYADGMTVNHINGDKLDNRPENLEWVTKGQNTRHAWQNGLVPLVGEKNPGARLNEKQVAFIRKLRDTGVRVSDLAGAFNVSTSHIYKICDGDRWAHVQSSSDSP